MSIKSEFENNPEVVKFATEIFDKHFTNDKYFPKWINWEEFKLEMLSLICEYLFSRIDDCDDEDEIIIYDVNSLLFPFTSNKVDIGSSFIMNYSMSEEFSIKVPDNIIKIFKS